MENIISIEELEKYQESVKELFRESVDPETYDTWADNFVIEEITPTQIIVVYDGSMKFKAFKKMCKKHLSACIYSVLGDGRKINLSKRKSIDSLSPKTKKNLRALKFFVVGMLFVCIATSIIIVMYNYIDNRNFRETFYITSSIKVDSRVRVIQLSDLHSSCYGNGNRNLLERVEALEPDVIICTGDMVDSVKANTDNLLSLTKGLAEIAPAYYVYGNNEVESIYSFPLNEKELDKKFGFRNGERDESALTSLKDSFEEKLEKTGIKVLKNEKDTIKVKTMTIDVYGVLNSNPSSFWSYSGQAFADYTENETDNIKITAVHEPFIFQDFEHDFWGDLVVCGHTHGGCIRVPVLGPLYTREGGLFPARGGDFVYGRYDVAGKPLIVSSGLSNAGLLRINNKPELVIIDINKF